jgi:hypothetical protein
MTEQSYGLIAEGDKDVAVYVELIRKICGSSAKVVSHAAGGREKLYQKLPGFLRNLEYAGPQGKAVEKALVVRDADGKNPRMVEEKLQGKISNCQFRFAFGIGIHVVVQKMDTWLLADVDAINRVSTSRGGKSVQAVRDPLEQIQDSKATLQNLLSEARLNYTPEVCRLIAGETDLTTLRRRCPSFGEFERKALDP